MTGFVTYNALPNAPAVTLQDLITLWQVSTNTTRQAPISELVGILGNSFPNGIMATGAFSGSYSDGTVVDYTSGTGRISVGQGDGLSVYNNGPGGNSLLTISATGNVVATGTLTGTQLIVGAPAVSLIGVVAGQLTKSAPSGSVEFDIQNSSAGSLASTDYIVNADNATTSSNYADFGINSSNNSDASYTAFAAGDVYLYAQSGNLDFATATGGKNIKFFVGGTLTANLSATLTSTGINNTAVGATTASTGAFTTISATGKASLAASVTGAASANIPQGVAPSVPANGDVWTTSSGFFVQINSVTTQMAILGANTFTGKQTTPASASGGAGFSLLPGTAPSSPVNGDMWTTSAGVYAQINGSTVGPLAAGGSLTALTGDVTASGAGSVTASLAHTAQTELISIWLR